MPPVSILIKPASSSCNMRCRYCFYADVSQRREVKNAGIMDADTHENLVRKAMEYAEGSVSFAFQGGEPTLAGLDFYRRHIRLIEKYAKKGVSVTNSLQTNGYAIDGEWAKFFAENGFLVGLSLDGPREIHDLFRSDAAGNGTFGRIKRASEILAHSRVEFNILCVVTDYTARHADKILNFFIKSGFDYLQFIPCLDALGDAPERRALTPQRYGEFLRSSFDKYYDCFTRKRFLSIRNFDNYISLLLGRPAENCGMNGTCATYFVIEADGSVYPCDFYVLDEYCGGNINRDALQTVRDSPPFRRFVEQSLPIDRACKTCKWFALCKGGCRRYREPFADGMPTLNLYCESFKMFFETCAVRLADMARAIATGY